MHRSTSSPSAVPTPETSKVSPALTLAVGTGRREGEAGPSNNNHAPGVTERVWKPASELQMIDPRQFQLNQLRRRFSAAERDDHEATALTFKLVPTDPDFPFDMADLQCTLFVPHTYPSKGRPSLRVTNPEMDRGYQINVERGFDSLVEARPKSTLLALLNELDKRLEGFLVAEKAQTVKLVINTGKKTAIRASNPVAAPEKSTAPSTAPESSLLSPPPPPPPPRYAPQQIAEAKAKRESDLRQLEARMGRQPLFSKSPDGLSFSVPLQIPTLAKLPTPLRSVKTVQLLVPLSYNLEPCSLSLVGVPSNEAAAVQASFERHARAHPEMTLMAHVNHLNQNMHTMAMEALATPPANPSMLPSTAIDTALQNSKEAVTDRWDDRPHVQIIPRPPEWEPRVDDEDAGSDLSGTDGSEVESSEDETEQQDDGGAVIPPQTQAATDPGPDLGILLSFPSLEIYGAELLQLGSVSLTVKCDRCKETRDIKGIRSHAPCDTSSIKHENCNKCANQLRIGGCCCCCLTSPLNR